jgi:cell wall-associated NlpC family hydrolase
VKRRNVGLTVAATVLSIGLTGCASDPQEGGEGFSVADTLRSLGNPGDEVQRHADQTSKKAEEDKASADAAEKAEKNKKAASREDPVVTRNDRAVKEAPSGVPAFVTATNWAQTKLGHKYVWGGESDEEGGFDCSGLMQAAWAEAGVKLPRVAHAQYYASKVHPKRSQLNPGDLVFYKNSSGEIYHVGLYVGLDEKGRQTMLHAPNRNRVIQFDPIDYMNGYFGATRVGEE